MTTETTTDHLTRLDGLRSVMENSPIPIQKFFDRLPEGFSLLDISEFPAAIFKLKEHWSKKQGEIINMPAYSGVGVLIERIGAQKQVNAVSMLGQFDKIRGNEEKKAVLAAIKNKLKPEGMLLITVPVPSGIGKITLADRLKTMLTNLLYTPEQYRAIVEESGLTIIGGVLRSTAPETITKPKNFIYEILAQRPAGQIPSTQTEISA